MGRRLVRGRSRLPRWADRRSALALLGVALGALTGAPAAARAQSVLGGFDDATVPASREIRIRLGAFFSTFDQQYGGFSTAPDDKRFPAGARYAFDALGVTQLPVLAPLQTALPGITEGTPDAISLGHTTARSRVGILTIPFTGELGITRRISLGITIPTVRTRHVVDVQVNTGGATGNVGFNPALDASFGATLAGAARTQNGAVQDQFTTAINNLQTLLTNCATTPTGTGCAPIVANRARAEALKTSADAFRQGVLQVYGSGTTTGGAGLAFVPVAGSPLQQQVERRLAALRSAFDSLGVTNIAATTRPVGSPARIAAAGLQRILTTEAFGIQADSLQSLTRSSTGDIDLTGTFLLVDTFGQGAARLAPRSGFRVRATATAGYRVGFSAGEDVPQLLTDIPTASGANAILVRGAADLAFGKRAWATVAARWASPMADEQVVRITDVPEQPFPELFRQQLVGRQLGRELELQLTPRWSFGEYVAVAAQYALRDKAADSYTGTFTLDSAAGGGTLDASTLGIGTAQREQRVGFGITYSTVAAYLRRRANIPVEVSVLHQETIAGSNVPKLSTDVLQLRLYLGLRGRR